MDPLAQLKDIHLPEPVHNYPLAYGWWLLLAALIFLCVWAISRYLKYKKMVRARNSAMSYLMEDIENNDKVITILKWAAFQYYPRAEVASLHGNALHQFFIEKLPAKHQEKFISLSSDIIEKRYTSQEQKSDSLIEAARFWLTNALPPASRRRKL